MSEYTTYRVVYCGDNTGVDQVAVGKMLAEGWELWGDPIVLGGTRLYQAMVKPAAAPAPSPSEQISTTALKLDARCWNCLERANLRTVADILAFDFVNGPYITNFGRTSMKRVNDELERLGFSPRPMRTAWMTRGR